GLAHEDEELAAWIHRSRGPPFPAIDDQIVAIANDAALDIGRVRGRNIRFRHRETGTNLSIQKRPKPSALLLRGPIAVEDFHVPGIRGRAVEDLGCPGDAAHDFAEWRVLQVGKPAALRGVRKEKFPEARRPGLRLQPFDKGGRSPAVVAGRLLSILLLVWVDKLAHEVVQFFL